MLVICSGMAAMGELPTEGSKGNVVSQVLATEAGDKGARGNSPLRDQFSGTGLRTRSATSSRRLLQSSDLKIASRDSLALLQDFRAFLQVSHRSSNALFD